MNFTRSRARRWEQSCDWIDRAALPLPVLLASFAKFVYHIPLTLADKHQVANCDPTHGLPHPIHNIGFFSRLCGQYVCSKSSANPLLSQIASIRLPTLRFILPSLFR
jgi:hypothetical protein